MEPKEKLESKSPKVVPCRKSIRNLIIVEKYNGWLTFSSTALSMFLPFSTSCSDSSQVSLLHETYILWLLSWVLEHMQKNTMLFFPSFLLDPFRQICSYCSEPVIDSLCKHFYVYYNCKNCLPSKIALNVDAQKSKDSKELLTILSTTLIDM